MKKPLRTIKEAWSNTTASQGTTWDPTVGRSPFNIVTGTGFLDNVISGKVSEEEKTQKAPKVLPFPLDRSIDQLVDIYQNLTKFKITLQSAIKNALLSKEEKQILRQKQREIESFMKSIKIMSYEIERMHL